MNKHILYNILYGKSYARLLEIIKLKNAYEHIEKSCVLLRKVSDYEQMLILDIGGGSGNTLKLFRNNFPQNTIHVFEPIPSNQELIKNKKIPGNVFLHPFALGDSNGQTTFYLTNNITSSSLLKPENSDGYSKEIGYKSEMTIEVKRLDSVLDSSADIGIAKLDVQGFELHVLKGLGDLLSRTRIVVMEINNHQGYENAVTYYEMDNFMRDNGFVLTDIIPGRNPLGTLLDWDAIYTRK